MTDRLPCASRYRRMAWRKTQAIEASFASAISTTRLYCCSARMTELWNSFLPDRGAIGALTRPIRPYAKCAWDCYALRTVRNTSRGTAYLDEWMWVCFSTKGSVTVLVSLI